MSELISVLIADDNVEFCSMLHEYLEQTGDMTVRGIARDGIETLGLIDEIEPDVIVLDVIMPNLDGIGVLERLSLRPPDRRPIVIALSAIGKDVIVQKALELGADYYMIKPFEVEILASRIRQLYTERDAMYGQAAGILRTGTGLMRGNEESMEQVVSTMIKRMGITPNVAGYRYLREAVMMCINQPIAIKSAAKSIYPVLAEKHNTTSRNIDRAIRCAIDSANKKSKCDNNPEQALIITIGRKKPSNTQIIEFLTEKALRTKFENKFKV